jgi:non-homologous end joining protein Ku
MSEKDAQIMTAASSLVKLYQRQINTLKEIHDADDCPQDVRDQIAEMIKEKEEAIQKLRNES